MRGRVLISVVAIVAMMVGATPAGAATFGEPDDGEHPFVGLVYFETPDGIFRCSGTLMSPDVVLTAGHCTESAGGVVNSRTWVSFTEHIVIPDDVLELPDDEFGDYLDARADFVAGQAVPHPDYDDFADFPRTFDVGLVLLEEPVVMDVYGALPPVGLLEGLTGKDKRGFTVVGYGLQGFINPFFGAERARYKGDVSLVEVKSTSNAGHSAKFTNNPGQGNGSGGSCFGDSGGPVLRDGNVVVAVVSWGITPCIGVDYQFRIDTAIALDFLEPYLS